jgi:hypothetical protein
MTASINPWNGGSQKWFAPNEWLLDGLIWTERKGKFRKPWHWHHIRQRRKRPNQCRCQSKANHHPEISLCMIEINRPQSTFIELEKLQWRSDMFKNRFIDHGRLAGQMSWFPASTPANLILSIVVIGNRLHVRSVDKIIAENDEGMKIKLLSPKKKLNHG